MAGRPSKPFTVLQSEKKSHRTRAELEKRKEEEEALLSGIKMKEKTEVKQSEEAHREFKRLQRLFKNIQKNDDLFGACINRYCQMVAECKDFEEKRETFYRRIKSLEERENEILDSEEMSVGEYYKLCANLESQVIALDKQIMAKRKLMFEYEKENVMTVASGLRNIPKKETQEQDPLQKALFGS